MFKSKKDNDVVFSSEKFENRIRLRRMLLPIIIAVLVIGLAIAVAFIVRASKGIRYTGGEDTPYPYSWRNDRKGVMTLDLTRSEDPEKSWLLVNVDPIGITTEEAKKQPDDVVRYIITPNETGRHTLSFLLMDGEEAAVKLDMLIDTTVGEKGRLTTDIISSSILERQTPQDGGAETYFPYSFRTDTNSFLVITIVNNTDASVTDWDCVSENEKAVQAGGIFFMGNETEVYLIPGKTEGTGTVTVSSAEADATITLEVERTSAGTLLVRSHSMQGGTTFLEAPVYYSEDVEGSGAQDQEAPTDETPADEGSEI